MPGAISTALPMNADVVVAYSCSSKKRKFFEQLAKASDDIPGLTLVPYDQLNGAKYDGLLHKRTDDLVASLVGDKKAKERLREFRAMCSGPVVSIDEVHGVTKLVDRASMARSVEHALENTPSVRFSFRHLKWCVVRADHKLRGMLCDFEYPVIMKRRLACGSAESHKMAVCHDAESAYNAALDMVSGAKDEFGSSLFVQEYVEDHGGVLFKLYAIGERVEVQARCVDHDVGTGVVHFDSQVMSRSAATLSADAVSASMAPMMARELTRRVSSMMRNELNLQLIGIDIIWDANARRYAIVDVNYFPGYKGVKGASRSILMHALEKVRERRRLDNAALGHLTPNGFPTTSTHNLFTDNTAGHAPERAAVVGGAVEPAF